MVCGVPKLCQFGGGPCFPGYRSESGRVSPIGHHRGDLFLMFGTLLGDATVSRELALGTKVCSHKQEESEIHWHKV